MFRTLMFLTMLLVTSCLCCNVAFAKDLSKAGGYAVCQNAINSNFKARAGKGIDTKLVKIKHTPKKRSRAGVIHEVTIRVSGVKGALQAENSPATKN